MKRFLFGVQHKDINEINIILYRLESIKPKHIGLELPIDYPERFKMGIKDNFFSKIYEQFNGKVITLESPTLYNKQQELDLVKHIKDEKIRLESIIEEYDSYKNINLTYKPPEVVRLYEFFLTRYKNVLNLMKLDQNIIQQKWCQNNVERENFMIKQILKYKPKTIIIGNAHALALKDRLNRYQYEALT